MFFSLLVQSCMKLRIYCFKLNTVSPHFGPYSHSPNITSIYYIHGALPSAGDTKVNKDLPKYPNCRTGYERIRQEPRQGRRQWVGTWNGIILGEMVGEGVLAQAVGQGMG